MEIWKDVVGYEGRYQVSCRGRVKSLDRYVDYKAGSRRKVLGRILKAAYLPKGYQKFELWRENKGKGCYGHQLVCAAFIGQRPEGCECRHLNGDPADNRAENLVYGTPAENEADKVAHGRRQFGEKCYNTNLTNADALRIKRLASDGELSQREIGKMFGVTHRVVSNIKNARRWTHLEETI